MKDLYIIRKKETIVGIYDDLSLFFKDPLPENKNFEETVVIGKHFVDMVQLNVTNIKPNEIIFKGKEFNHGNLDDPLPLLDVSDPTFL